MNGKSILRAALQRKRNNMAAIAQSVDCGVEALDGFTRGEVALSSTVLKGLAKQLFHGDYDVARDALLLTGAPHPYVPPGSKVESFH